MGLGLNHVYWWPHRWWPETMLTLEDLAHEDRNKENTVRLVHLSQPIHGLRVQLILFLGQK